MFILRNPPNIFTNGDILSPDQVNDSNSYFAGALDFVANRQNARWTSTYSLTPGPTLPLTSASPLTDLRRDIPPPSVRADGYTYITIESVDIVAYYTATTEFALYVNDLTTSGNNLLRTASTEVITFPAREADQANVPYQVTRLMAATSDSTDLFALSAPISNGAAAAALPAGVSISRIDITVGFISSRYRAFGTTVTAPPTVNLPELTDASTANPSVFSSMKSTIEAAATAAHAGRPLRWVSADFRSVDAFTALGRKSVVLPGFADFLPGIDSAAAVRGAYIDAWLDAGNAGETVSYGISTAPYYITTPLPVSGFQRLIGGAVFPASPPTTILNTAQLLRLDASGDVQIRRATVYLLLG
jgi:hypothetical protein